jgi:hypothetical protein
MVPLWLVIIAASLRGLAAQMLCASANNYNLFVSQTPMYHFDAVSFCQGQGMTLANITSQDVEQLMPTMLGYCGVDPVLGYVWLGAVDGYTGMNCLALQGNQSVAMLNGNGCSQTALYVLCQPYPVRIATGCNQVTTVTTTTTWLPNPSSLTSGIPLPVLTTRTLLTATIQSTFSSTHTTTTTTALGSTATSVSVTPLISLSNAISSTQTQTTTTSIIIGGTTVITTTSSSIYTASISVTSTVTAIIATSHSTTTLSVISPVWSPTVQATCSGTTYVLTHDASLTTLTTTTSLTQTTSLGIMPSTHA